MSLAQLAYYKPDACKGSDVHLSPCTKNDVSIRDFFNKYKEFRKKLVICSQLLKKYSMENSIFSSVLIRLSRD